MVLYKPPNILDHEKRKAFQIMLYVLFRDILKPNYNAFKSNHI